jgi:Asp-tRNA(Asn)/Glu-tRNA(Gln) amidotransferase C subunit
MRLARLAMLSVGDTEAERLSSEMNAILDFFSSVRGYPAQRQVNQTGQSAREDGDSTSRTGEAESIVSNFPARDGKNLNVPRGI